MVNIADQSLNRDVSHGLLEEKLSYDTPRDDPQCRHHQEEFPKAGGLAGVLVADVLPQEHLGLVLEHLHGPCVSQAKDL